MPKISKDLKNPALSLANMTHRITLLRIRRTQSSDVNHDLQWIGNSLGLFGLRDKDSSCFRIFITLVKRSHKSEPLSSDDIAHATDLSRATALHHLEKLVEAGLVLKEKDGYIMRESTLARVVKQMQHDVNQIFSEIEEVAKEIDNKMG